MMQTTVIHAHRAPFPQPIRFEKGDRLVLGCEDQDYPGWIWTTTEAGDSGWAPQALVDPRGQQAIALEDYDSRELPTAAGERLCVDRRLAGWCWVTNQAGQSGWVPDNSLSLDKSDGRALRQAKR
jgi:hypothetical protein